VSAETVELVVVGAGPAGLHAALAAADASVEVLVLDENPDIGGQIHRQPPYLEGASRGESDREAQGLFEAVRRHARIRILTSAQVWGIFPERMVAIAQGEHSRQLVARALVLCPGAYDRAVPFPGWTLPGVFPAGGALTLIKSQRVLPGRRVLLAGTGPIQFVLAQHLLAAGAEIVALLEGSRTRPRWPHLRQLMAAPRPLAAGVAYLFRMRRAGVRTLRGHTIVRAVGDDRVGSAVVAQIDRQWKPVAGTEETLDVDAVVCSFGFVPSIELTAMSGCEHEYREAVGGWVPRFGPDMETSVAGVFVAGEASGVAGAVVAAEEGTLAGIGAARHLGRLSADSAALRGAKVRRRLQRLYRFRSAVDDLYAVGPGLTDLISPTTVVCRCEEVHASQLAEALADGATSPRDVKIRTRAGMGHCQGRMCEPSIAQLIARTRGITVEKVGPPSSRPPARPVTLRALTETVE
jgi:thioredoxin reductase/bacterioferritin-associated ferredoxin